MTSQIKAIVKELMPSSLLGMVRHWRKVINTRRLMLRDRWLCFRRKKEVNPPTGKVSVIIPTLSKGKQANHLQTLRKLLSVYLPRQTYQDYEAIVYCDGPNPDVEAMVMELKDDRVRLFATDTTLGKWGHPQTRLGIAVATGDYFVRMNDDNAPWSNYLETLLTGFNADVGIVYGRVIYKGEARRVHSRALVRSFVLPGDIQGTLEHMNIDCMNYMVRMDLAKQYVENWDDSYLADWIFVDSLVRKQARALFKDVLIGEKH